MTAAGGASAGFAQWRLSAAPDADPQQRRLAAARAVGAQKAVACFALCLPADGANICRRPSLGHTSGASGEPLIRIWLAGW